MPGIAGAVQVFDIDDPRVRDFARLTDVSFRRMVEPEWGMFLAESTLVIERVIELGYDIRSILIADNLLWHLDKFAEDIADTQIYIADPEILRGITGFEVHRGALAAVARKPQRPLADVLEGSRRIVALDGLVNHTNVGAIFRSAAALGIDGILISPDCADPLYRRAVRVSMGATLSLPWTRSTNWRGDLLGLKERGFVVAALTPAEDAVDLDELAARRDPLLALVIGSEGHGLAFDVMNICDARVRIPMADGIDSLNAAAASAVACYAVTR